jgi:hypothetical protein
VTAKKRPPAPKPRDAKPKANKPASGGAAAPAKAAPAARLAVLLDERPISDDEARTLWQEFSRHMDENEGDLTGFAEKKGWASVRPEHRQGRAVLIVSSR